MAYPIPLLQKALYDRLTGVAGLTALLSGGANSVFDYVKQDSAFPYIVIGEFTAVMDGDKIKTGHEITATIHVFDKGRGRKTTELIMEQIHNAIDRQESAFTLTGFQVVLSMFEFSDIFIDDDDTNFYPHGVMRFRFNIREA